MSTVASRRVRPAANPVEPSAPSAPVLAFVDAIPRLAAFAVVAIGIVGTPLLLVGDFRRLPVGLGAGALFVALELIWRRHRPRLGRASRRTAIVSLLALLVAVCSMGVNARLASQHLLVDGDPAVYAVTGQLIADNGTLVTPTHNRTVFGDASTLNYAGAGFDASPDESTVRPSFLHLLPETLAIASWVGGPRLLLSFNAVLAGFGLLAIFAFGARLVRPVWALVAIIALALTLPEQFFARDAFSEIPSQLLVFAGLTLLADLLRRSQHSIGPSPAYLGTSGGGRVGAAVLGAIAGLVLGGSCIARIDAFFYLVPLTALIAVLVLARRALLAAGLAAGLAVAAAIGYADLRAGSPGYLALQRHDLHLVWAALGAIVVLGAVSVALGGRLRTVWEHRADLRRRALAPTVTLGVLALAAFGYLARPHLGVAHNLAAGQPTAVPALQKAEGLPIDPTRSYDGMSLHWLAWYIGPIALALGIIGFALLLRRLLRGERGSLPTLAFVLVFGASTALYVWRPSIVPVQYWATRRYLPVTFPGLLLCAGWALDALWRWAARRASASARSSAPALAPALAPAPAPAPALASGPISGPALARVGAGLAGLGALAMVVAPAAYLGKHVAFHSYSPMLAATDALCDALGPHDAALVLGGSHLATGIPQTIEAFCQVPTAVISASTGQADLRRAAAAARAAGRRLVYVSEVPNRALPDGPVAGDFHRIADVRLRTAALSISHRPDNEYDLPLQIWVAVAPPPNQIGSAPPA